MMLKTNITASVVSMPNTPAPPTKTTFHPMPLSPADLSILVALIIGQVHLLENPRAVLPPGFPWVSIPLSLHNSTSISRARASWFNSFNVLLDYRTRTEDTMSQSWNIVVGHSNDSPHPAGEPIAVFEIPAPIWGHADRRLYFDATFVLVGVRLSLQNGTPIGVRARIHVEEGHYVERFDYVDLQARHGHVRVVQRGICKRLEMCRAPVTPPCQVLLHRSGPTSLCAKHHQQFRARGA
ncbi:hypothetical protein FB45DRAFT_956785 [Roridomyces roridus]|uniref:Uncharacterized protein n=1 Tax=Roridomyces roridus TaxID=1738132 RepID=A0AAD7F893_9AGAR|nr:hypothetical protein FB45DRAFT_956785 [Roridomyces roridus]